MNVTLIIGELCATRMSKVEIEGHQVPLSERMLREPFWLGLLTVFLVMIMISIGYLLRKHLPEKMGKFLINDQDTGSMEDSNTGEELAYYKYKFHDFLQCHFILGCSNFLTPRMSFASDMVELLDVPSSPTPKTFLGKLTVRKPSILSISSATSSHGSSSPNLIRRTASPMQDEEKRKILKMLISPSSERKPSKNINDFMMMANQTIKAAKSAENLCTNNQVINCI